MKGEKNLECPGEEGSHPLHISPIPSWRDDSERSNSLILLCILFQLFLSKLETLWKTDEKIGNIGSVAL